MNEAPVLDNAADLFFIPLRESSFHSAFNLQEREVTQD